MKSEEQKNKELEKIADYYKYRNEGMKKGEAAKAVGMTAPGMSYLLKRYPNSFEKSLTESNFNPESWTTGWQRYYDEEGKIEKSILIKNDRVKEARNLFAEFAESLNNYSFKYKKFERKKGDCMLVVDMCDPHFGKYSSSTRNGETYNLDIAKKRFLNGVRDVLAQAEVYDIEKILFITGNDLLHVSGPNNTTTKGTPQDVCCHWDEAFVYAMPIVIEAIEMCMQVADVEVIYDMANHDTQTGYGLIKAVESWFRHSDQVTFDTHNEPLKCLTYGKSLIATGHGDKMSDKDLAYKLPMLAGDLWGSHQYRYIYRHHKHHLEEKEFNSVKVHGMPSISDADRYHVENGYDSIPSSVGFVICKEKGERARFRTYCE